MRASFIFAIVSWTILFGFTQASLGNVPDCASSDPGHVCLALKWVSYLDSRGAPTITESTARATLEGVNKLWSQCKLSFSVSSFELVRAEDQGLQYSLKNMSELEKVRAQFSEGNALLVVVSGPWDRSGTLRSANAWTILPGALQSGAIIEKTVGENVNLVAHELGHYLNLTHLTEPTGLMSPVVYSRSTALSSGECDRARAAAVNFWSRATR